LFQDTTNLKQVWGCQEHAALSARLLLRMLDCLLCCLGVCAGLNLHAAAMLEASETDRGAIEGPASIGPAEAYC
jgi:hypothetical protein